MSMKKIMKCWELKPGMTFSMNKKDDPGERWVIDRLISDGEEFNGEAIRNERRNIWVVSPVGGGRSVLACFDQVFRPKQYHLRVEPCHFQTASK